MPGITDYAQPLRAIGQALETLSIQNFELEPMGGVYRVRGTLAKANTELSGDGLTSDNLTRVWGEMSDLNLAERNPETAPAATVLLPIELHYTAEDIDRLDQEGQIKRADAHRLPDTASLSQGLRCVGAYLNKKGARLVKLWRNAESVSVEYETSLGSQFKETLMKAELYDLWVRMYLQRAERAS